MDIDSDGALRVRAAVLDRAWADLESRDGGEAALRFFESPRFDYWAGVGRDLSGARERARRIYADAKAKPRAPGARRKRPRRDA